MEPPSTVAGGFSAEMEVVACEGEGWRNRGAPGVREGWEGEEEEGGAGMRGGETGPAGIDSVDEGGLMSAGRLLVTLEAAGAGVGAAGAGEGSG